MKIRDTFSNISKKAAEIAGSWQASVLATAIVVSWIVGGFFIGFNNELYQLFINTFTTITTFVMVFLIQASQNRQEKAVQLKLDEIICVIQKADDKLINIEDATDDEISEAKDKIGSSR